MNTESKQFLKVFLGSIAVLLGTSAGAWLFVLLFSQPRSSVEPIINFTLALDVFGYAWYSKVAINKGIFWFISVAFLIATLSTAFEAVVGYFVHL